MRNIFSILFFVLALVMALCANLARRSKRMIGLSVELLLASLIPPLIGNLIIITSSVKSISLIGAYIYYLGMDLVMFSLLKFTLTYCRINWKSSFLRNLVYALLIIDAVQLLLNPFFGHAFSMEAIIVDGAPYYRMIPHIGQTFHRVVDYSIFLSVLNIFVYKMITSPQIYSERYWVILVSMIVGGLWQTYYIFSRTPIDRSMIGFAGFGLMVFYFAIYYRPLRLLDRMLANIASSMPDAIFFFDAIGRCIWANQPAIRLVGIPNEDFEQADLLLKKMFRKFEENGSGAWSDSASLGEGASARHYYLDKQLVYAENGRANGSFLSIRDVTDQERKLEIEKYNARHDKLTGLYNKERLYEKIRETIDSNPDTAYLIIFADVKDFKIINDIFGNAFGDYTLQCIADLIRKYMNSSCIYGRLGGDTFGICAPKGEFERGHFEDVLSEFSIVDGSIEQHVLIHLGIYEVSEPDLDISIMFDRAHMAISTIKEDYQKHIAYYDDEMRDQVLWNQHISTQLSMAIRRKEIVPYLQPIVNIYGKVVGAEALVRWVHPVDGFLNPASFIPVFEKNGMIIEIDKYMWRSACEMLARWKEEGRDDLFISVNISPKDFYFMNVNEEIKKIVSEYGVDPSRLRIEITETVMMSDVENRMRILNDLKESGFIVEMDDFGSGYSSLNLLKDMPVDVLKIDMAFLNKSKEGEKAQTIIHNIINMSDDLGIESLTEGVETDKQYHLLTEMGCKLFQGYYFAKPMPVTDFESFCFERNEKQAYS